MARRAARVDANQGDIIAGLRRVGAQVQPIHVVGKGCPDIMVAFRGAWYVAELKDGNKPPSDRKLTPDEIEWHDKFNRVAPVYVWTSIEDALLTIGATGL